MTRNAYLIIALVLVAVIAGLVYIKTKGGGDEVLAPTGEEVTSTSTSPQSPTSTSTSPPNPPAGEGTPTPAPTPTQALSTKTVTYTTSGFSPASLTIKAGDTVVFKNNSAADFWPASGPHPTHTNYPEFDAKREIAPGASYSFTFARTGSWKYHNHLNPALTGTITVQ